MKQYIRLARPHHWIKNALVLLPLLCSGAFFQTDRLIRGLWGFAAFSLIASCIYVINDIKDRENDRYNSSKQDRPIASGAVSVQSGIVFCIMLGILGAGCGILACRGVLSAWAALAAYFLLNLAYSMGLKKVPLLDVAILVSGFLIRIIFGGIVTDIAVSKWLYLTVIAASFYLGLGKRRNELAGGKTASREVLKFYSLSFLDKNMYVFIALTVVFYSLWTVDAVTVERVGSDNLLWTVPLVILICLKYSLDVENPDCDGDPVEVIIRDPVLLGLVALLLLVFVSILYFR